MGRKVYERALYDAKTGRQVATVYDTSMPENVFDPVGGRWVVVCEEHSTLVNVDTLRDAIALGDQRREFCEEEP